MVKLFSLYPVEDRKLTVEQMAQSIIKEDEGQTVAGGNTTPSFTPLPAAAVLPTFAMS